MAPKSGGVDWWGIGGVAQEVGLVRYRYFFIQFKLPKSSYQTIVFFPILTYEIKQKKNKIHKRFLKILSALIKSHHFAVVLRSQLKKVKKNF